MRARDALYPVRVWRWRLALLAQHPEMLPFFRFHVQSLSSGRNAITDQIPWVTYGARGWLDRYLRRDMNVFEWGSGGSTIYVAKRVRSLTSIEHDAQWFGEVQLALREADIRNCNHILVPPDLIQDPTVDWSIPGNYRSTSPGSESLSFSDYCRAIERSDTQKYDLIIIDGRARVSCAFHALRRAAASAALLLDNSDRPQYDLIRQMMTEDWTRKNFPGLAPYSNETTATTAWIRCSAQ
jgi:hypothetical protein